MINSQQLDEGRLVGASISKGMGDQFSASSETLTVSEQYVKGDG